MEPIRLSELKKSQTQLLNVTKTKIKATNITETTTPTEDIHHF